jgi:hypothetical protein
MNNFEPRLPATIPHNDDPPAKSSYELCLQVEKHALERLAKVVNGPPPIQRVA